MVIGEKISTNGRGVLVTGCASGFGHQLAIKLHALGFTVFACCLDDESDGGRKLKSIGKDTGRLHVIKMDVTNEVEVRQAFLYVKDNLPRLGLWGLVNNAGRSYVSFIEWFPMEFYEKVVLLIETIHIDILNCVERSAFGSQLVGYHSGNSNVLAVNPQEPRKDRSYVIHPWASSHYLVRSLQHHVICLNRNLVAQDYRNFETKVFSIDCSKFGLEAFSDALRVEMYRFKVKVCIVEPGNCNFLLAIHLMFKYLLT